MKTTEYDGIELNEYKGQYSLNAIQISKDGKDGKEYKRWRKVSKGRDEYADKATPMKGCLLYTSPSPRDTERSRMPSSA